MKINILLSIVILFFSTNESFSQIRRGLFKTNIPIMAPGAEPPTEFSILSIGTMMGFTYSIDKPTKYKVVDGFVKIEDNGDNWDRMLPAVYALPSINLFGTPGKSWSGIVPVNLNTDKELSIGLGISRGFNVKSSVEIGFSALLIWSNVQNLNFAQEESFKNNTKLSENESLEIATGKRPSLGIGFYIVPLLTK